MIVTLSEAKKHLNIESTFLEDDEYVTSLILLSENLIEKDIRKTIASIQLLEGSVPAVLKHASKMLIGNFYTNREDIIVGTQMVKVPLSYKYLVSKYKIYTVG